MSSYFSNAIDLSVLLMPRDCIADRRWRCNFDDADNPFQLVENFMVFISVLPLFQKDATSALLS